MSYNKTIGAFLHQEFSQPSKVMFTILGLINHYVNSKACINCINRGSYMSAHVLLNLLKELGKRDKMRSCRAFYLFFSQRV